MVIPERIAFVILLDHVVILLEGIIFVILLEGVVFVILLEWIVFVILLEQ